MSATPAAVSDAIRELFKERNGLTAKEIYYSVDGCLDIDIDKSPSLTTVRRYLKAMVARGELTAFQEDDYEDGGRLRWITSIHFYRPGTKPKPIEPPLTWEQIERPLKMRDLGWAT